MAEWSPELHRNIFHEQTSCGQWSKCLHAHKHKNKRSTYENDVQEYIAKTIDQSSGDQLDYDILPPFARSAQSSACTTPLPSSTHGTHIQFGSPRVQPPWLPPFMRSPPHSPCSPGVRGIAGLRPALLERTGGGFVERGRKQLGYSGWFRDFKWGPRLGSASSGPVAEAGSPRAKMLRPNPRLPSVAERALWIQGKSSGNYPTNMGVNFKQRFDIPQEPLHLISTETACLFEKNNLPLTPRLGKVKVIPSDQLPQLPIRRPITSQDLYRLEQFVCTERSTVC